MRDILVIRFGSLGDLCLLGWSLAALNDHAGDDRPRVTLATKVAFAPLMSRVRGVDRVESLASTGEGGLLGLAQRLRRRHWDRILDAHHILRGHMLLALLGRRSHARLSKDTAARLRLLAAARRDRGPALSPAPPPRTMADRFNAVIAAAQVPTLPLPEATTPPLFHLAAGRDRGAPLGLAPGAQWGTKRWPAGRFARVLRAMLDDTAVNVRIFLGPREEAWFAGSELAQVAGVSPRVELVRGLPLVGTAERLAQCRVLLTNDSGLLHLAEAVGVPVLALFGPTVREFGYFPRLPASRVLETAIGCRPCSRNGKRPCRRGDLACLDGISEVMVLEALADMGGLT